MILIYKRQRGGAELMGDDLEQLHGFAARLGLRREAFGAGVLPRYQIREFSRIDRAIQQGAVEISGKDMASMLAAGRVELPEQKATLPKPRGFNARAVKVRYQAARFY